jgi:hypothetical protein
MGNEVIFAMGPFRLTHNTLHIGESTYTVASIDGVQIDKAGLGIDVVVMPLGLIGCCAFLVMGAPLVAVLGFAGWLAYAVHRSRRRVLYLLMNGVRFPALESTDQPSLTAFCAAFASAKALSQPSPR